jgi:uncharacterized damage-inducible protein DinB
MNRTKQLLSCIGLMVATCAGMFAQTQRQPPTPALGISLEFADLNRKVLEMAKAFPEAKYGYKPGSDLRSFGDVIVHIASGNIFAAKIGRGEKVKWDELDPKDYKTKEAIVAVLDKSIADATASLKAIPADYFIKTLNPWLSVIEHAGEHYGQLVVYYRNNGLVPPESRKK